MKNIKNNLYKIIFETDTKSGKRFDIVLLWLILISIVVVILESVSSISKGNETVFRIIDWAITIVFTLEYLCRIYVSPNRKKYVLSSWGLIDFISISPSYLNLFIVGTQYLLIIRILRLLRVFRVLRLVNFTREGQLLLFALKASFYKIGVFMLFVFTLVVMLGTVMYVIEKDNPGFSSIPSSIYWGIVTITTVGFGDIVPQTLLGKAIASFIMLCGYSIIAVPTGIVTVELAKNNLKTDKIIQNCYHKKYLTCNYCGDCGEKL